MRERCFLINVMSYHSCVQVATTAAAPLCDFIITHPILFCDVWFGALYSTNDYFLYLSTSLLHPLHFVFIIYKRRIVQLSHDTVTCPWVLALNWSKWIFFIFKAWRPTIIFLKALMSMCHYSHCRELNVASTSILLFCVVNVVLWM